MRASRIHIAIVTSEVAARLLAGTKQIESRFYRQKRLPYGRIARGETICFKLSGGEVICATRVTRVLELDNLTPRRMERLRRRYNHAVCAPPAYWRARRDCRYGVLMWLDVPRPAHGLRVPRQFGSGWLMVPAGSRAHE